MYFLKYSKWGNFSVLKNLNNPESTLNQENSVAIRTKGPSQNVSHPLTLTSKGGQTLPGDYLCNSRIKRKEMKFLRLSTQSKEDQGTFLSYLLVGKLS